MSERTQVSAAVKAAIRYIKLMALELARLPHRYGYDDGATYELSVQTWDRARVPARSLAFGRLAQGHERVGLIPDVYYIDSDGFSDLHRFALRSPRWRRRSANLAWRGSVTGQGAFTSPDDIPRVKLALACRGLPGADVALIGVHETLEFPQDRVADFIDKHGLLAASWPVHDFAFYKFVIDIDGHANAWGLLEKLILGCCVLKVESPFEQWFYPRLHAWEHYVPIAADLSDMAQAIQWCRENDDHCEWIAANGARLATTLRLQAELPRSCLEFMRTADATPG